MSGLVQLPERFMNPLVAQKRSGVYNSTNNFDQERSPRMTSAFLVPIT
jgi:hypothetical protein